MTHQEAVTSVHTMDAPAEIHRQSDLFAATLAETDPVARVPTCPDWNAADLLWHLTTVHAFWAAVLRTDPQTPEELAALEAQCPARPDSIVDMLPLRRRFTEELLTELDRWSDAEPRWSWWTPDQTVGFTRRMQTCEALIHRIDAELTAGTMLTPIEPALATAAVNHAIDVMLAWQPDDAQVTSAGIVALEASDTGLRYRVEVLSWSGTNPWTQEPMTGHRLRRLDNSEPAASARGSVADLALWLLTRPGNGVTEGDEQTLAAVRSLLAAGIV